MVKDVKELYMELELILHQFVHGKAKVRKLSQSLSF